MARFSDAANVFKVGVEALPGVVVGVLRFTPARSEISTDVYLTEDRGAIRNPIEQHFAKVVQHFSGEFKFQPPKFHSFTEESPSFSAHTGDDPEVYQEVYQFGGHDSTGKVLAALANPKYDWRTIEGVSRETGLDRRSVLEILDRMPAQVLRSVTPDPQGRDLYALRSRYRARRPMLQRFLDQFRSTVT
jgi:hypothetical protein